MLVITCIVKYYLLFLFRNRNKSMEKIFANFTKEEIKLLQGNFQKIAEKKKVSRTYVSQIANSEREIASEKSKEIFKSLQNFLEVLK